MPPSASYSSPPTARSCPETRGQGGSCFSYVLETFSHNTSRTKTVNPSSDPEVPSSREGNSGLCTYGLCIETQPWNPACEHGDSQPGCLCLPSPSTSQPKSVGPPARGPTLLPVDSPGIQPHRSPTGPKHAQPSRPSSFCGLSTCTPFPPDIFPFDCQAQAVSFLHLLRTRLPCHLPPSVGVPRGGRGCHHNSGANVHCFVPGPTQGLPPRTLHPCECPGEEKQGSFLVWPGPCPIHCSAPEREAPTASRRARASPPARCPTWQPSVGALPGVGHAGCKGPAC